MMLPVLLALSIQTGSVEIPRDRYGVPQIEAQNVVAAFEMVGYAVAEDRLQQMDVARKISLGIAVNGNSGLERLKTRYTDAELDSQIDKLAPETQAIWRAYVTGVNRYISTYNSRSDTKVKINPWTLRDSAAITVMMSERFGSGGGMELTLFAAYQYLKGQACKDHVLDVVDDLAWQNDPKSPTTLSQADEKQSTRIAFPEFNRKDTEKQLATIPNVSLLEMMPAIRLANAEETKALAAQNSVVHKMGSYCVVVGKDRSVSGYPMLLSGPQMGFTTPSVVHEIAIRTPKLKVCGMDVPGMPGVLVGNTPNLAWGLTTGVADTQDIVYSELVDDTHYRYGDTVLPIETHEIVAGSRGYNQLRTRFGPVILKSKASKAVFSLRRSYAMRELESSDQLAALYFAKTGPEVLKLAEKFTLGFNLFFATRKGDTGWAYCGLMPVRADHVDPRFPTPGTPQNDWRGLTSIASKVHVLNPKSGLLTNWNNKPVSWWNNLDTPVWGSPFRVQNLNDSIPKGKLAARDLEMAAWQIARKDDQTSLVFLGELQKILRKRNFTGVQNAAADAVKNWDGWFLDGSQGALIYSQYVQALREVIFLPHVGNFVNPSGFNTVTQPHVIQQALLGKTSYPFLKGRSAEDVQLAAFALAVERLSDGFGNMVSDWRYVPGRLPNPGGSPVPYSNRGTFIQIVEFGQNVNGRSVNYPGIAESGAHSNDQVILGASWTYKAMMPWRSDD